MHDMLAASPRRTAGMLKLDHVVFPVRDAGASLAAQEAEAGCADDKRRITCCTRSDCMLL